MELNQLLLAKYSTTSDILNKTSLYILAEILFNHSISTIV
jgi:hypothetical protein